MAEEEEKEEEEKEEEEEALGVFVPGDARGCPLIVKKLLRSGYPGFLPHSHLSHFLITPWEELLGPTGALG
eukprot:2433485-Pyramimonas_sp.AAC.1